MTEVTGNNSAQTALEDTGGNPISANFPLQVDGDSIYSKDINVALSDGGDFTGDILTLFNDYETEIVDSTANNPKILIIHLVRPIKSNQIGIGSKNGDFSNVKISLKDLSGTVRTVIDDSASNTKHTSNVYPFTTNVFIEILIEFHTVDTVTLSGMYVPKVQSRAISNIDGFISAKNSSLSPLGIGGIFQGEAENSRDYGAIQVALFSDQACTFLIEGRSTPTSTWREIDTYQVAAGEDKAWSFQGVRQFIRVTVTNGAIAQADFDLQVMFKPVYIKPSSHPIGGVVKANDDAELVKSQITGERPDSDFGNVAVTNGNNLKISLQEFDEIFNSLPLPVVDAILHGSKGLVTGLNKINKYGRAIDGIQTTMTDVWDRADAAATQQIWLAPTAARIHTIVSTAAADDGTPEGAGAGAQAVRVWYLPDWDTKETFEDVILNGVAGVAMNNAAVIIHRMKVIPVGTTYAINVGNITATAAVDGTITAQINVGQGQTNMAIYGIPSVQKAYLTGYITNAHETANPGTAVEVDFSMLINERPDLVTTVFLNKSNLGIRTTGNTAPYRPLNPYKEVEGPAIIKFQADATAADIEGVVEFDGWLVDN